MTREHTLHSIDVPGRPGADRFAPAPDGARPYPKRPGGRGRRLAGRIAAWFGALLIPLLAAVLTLLPALLMQPLRPQGPLDVRLAHFFSRGGLAIVVGLLALSLWLIARVWRNHAHWWSRAPLVFPVLFTGFAGWLLTQNPIEWVFERFEHPEYASVAAVDFVPDSAMVMALEVGGEAVAYPLAQMAYHHIVHDVVGGEPVVVTYCVLCRTGQAYDATFDGRPMRFFMKGTNNQNFIMQDERTGTWWQQATGEAVVGPLRGRSLKPLYHDRLSYGVWKREQPNGRVLKPEADKAAQGQYRVNWDKSNRRIQVFRSQAVDHRLAPRDVVYGLSVAGFTRAYPLAALQEQSPILDDTGAAPIVIVLGEDGRSVRAFERVANGRELEVFRDAAASPTRLIDAETGSTWDFTGRAVSGPLEGERLKPVYLFRVYWFEWSTDHPETELYVAGPAGHAIR
jgi:Protein of unknown function (DUF3179)